MITNPKMNTIDNTINIYRFNCDETPFTRRDLLQKFSVFKTFMDEFDCSLDEFCEILDTLCIRDSQLFDYNTYGDNKLMIAKDYFYTRKYKHREYVKVYYDLYIAVDNYVNLALNDVAREIFKRRFPEFMNRPFIKIKKRFNEKINELPKNKCIKMSTIDSFIYFDNNLTIDDFIKCYTDPNYMNSDVEESIFKIYSDGSIYMTVDSTKCGHTLGFTYKNLVNKDWKSIEEKHVFSILLYDKNGDIIKGKYYEGSQKYAPYFNHPLVEEFKNLLLSHIL